MWNSNSTNNTAASPYKYNSTAITDIWKQKLTSWDEQYKNDWIITDKTKWIPNQQPMWAPPALPNAAPPYNQGNWYEYEYKTVTTAVKIKTLKEHFGLDFVPSIGLILGKKYSLYTMDESGTNTQNLNYSKPLFAQYLVQLDSIQEDVGKYTFTALDTFQSLRIEYTYSYGLRWAVRELIE